MITSKIKIQLIHTTKLLTSFYTPTGDTKTAAKLIEIIKKTISKKSANRVYIKTFEKNEYPSILISNTPNIDKFKILINGHIDVLPQKDKHIVSEDSKFVYGRGALDMKGGVAVAITLFKNLHISYPFAIQFVSDEEIGGFNGTLHQLEQGVKAKFVIIPEPTNLDIENQAKGIIWIKGTIRGQSTHGAYPWKGNNPILILYQIMNLLDKNFKLKPNINTTETTITVSEVKSISKAFNESPNTCTFKLDTRYNPKSKKEVLQIIQQLQKSFLNLKMETIIDEPPFYVHHKNKYLKLLHKYAQEAKSNSIIKMGMGSSDARHFYKFGIPAIEFGPSGDGMGEKRERVNKNSLFKLYNTLENFLTSVN